MPSKSRTQFRGKLLPDVQSIIDAHRHLNPDGKGRRALGYLTRSGVLMLCAAWEVYIEDVIYESVDHLIKHTSSPHSLPEKMKTRICKIAKADPHDLGILKFAGDGWKDEYLAASRRDCDKLNTPKAHVVADLFRDWLAIEHLDLFNSWRHNKEVVNDFVSLRGEIAHRGADAQYVQIGTLREYKEQINDLVVDTDRFVSDYLKQISGKRFWNNT